MSQPAADATALAPGRIAGLDAWRALLMAGGLFVHGSAWLPPAPLFVLITDISHSFRMGAFFAISGFLTALALNRRDAAAWLRRRLVQLGVPALVGMSLLCPLIWLIVMTSDQASRNGWLSPFAWHHLWFLFALMLYSACAVVLHDLDRRHGLARRLDGVRAAESGQIALMLTALATAGLIALSLAVIRWAFSPQFLTTFHSAELIAGYLPMFVLGFVLARADRLRARAVAAHRLCLAICLGVVLAYAAADALAPDSVMLAAIRAAAAALCPPAVFLLILRSALSIRRVPALMGHVSEASYTVYILHYPISVLINTHVAIGVEPHLAYFLTILASGAASFAFHVLVVQRSPVLALLLNGKFERRTPAERAAAPAPELPVSEDALIAAGPLQPVVAATD